MRVRWILTIAAATTLGTLGLSRAPRHLNPMIELLEQKKPVFGLYAPRNAGGRGRGGAPPPVNAPPPKTAAQLAQDALAYKRADYIFDGSMEGNNFDAALTTFGDFAKGMSEGGFVDRSSMRLTHPLVVKTHKVAENPTLAAERIGKQLNLGVSVIVQVEVETADEVRAGIAAMRFKSKGGTRPDDVGAAPAYWGMSEKDYKAKADVWPLNPDGELMSWTIVETKEGLKNVREIAAVKGIGVLLPGAGTLRGMFTTQDSAGQRVFDAAGWEAAIQKVLAACKEFNVACGYPAGPADIEMRMKQGFSVFVINWGEQGFNAVEIGRKASGR